MYTYILHVYYPQLFNGEKITVTKFKSQFLWLKGGIPEKVPGEGSCSGKIIHEILEDAS